jgi:ribosomal protein L37E
MFLLCSYGNFPSTPGLPRFSRFAGGPVARIKRDILDDQERRRRAMPLGWLADQQLDVFCWCNRCGHNSVVETALLMRQLGPAMPVPEIGAHMRCTGCGSRDVATRPAWSAPEPITRHT